ncbi:MAG: NUDIX domain-containing protein [Candidatus Doudnabacteria bacterium]|nr:NUDIX domain-containing protein [Candidatus Doudnabacteria bacterium]
MKEQTTIVAALIKNEKGEILIDRRNQPDIPEEHNKWEFIGGKIEFGESPENALIREVKEESGLDVKIVRLLPKILSQLWLNQKPQRQIIILTYECQVIGGEIKAKTDEILELKFVKQEEIKNYDCLPNVDKIIASLNT